MTADKANAHDVAGEHPVLCKGRLFVLRVKALGVLEEAADIKTILVTVGQDIIIVPVRPSF
jgi:hypothetical protein